jgi:eukaryotic-like serine/threonine-protein kinase
VESSRTLVHTRSEALVLGRYRVLEELGSGGFGVVWRAHDELLHRDVALKRVWLQADGGSVDSDRASREAQAAARLSHPAIVALHEACVHDEAFYLISELVEGDTLAQLIAADALEDEEVLEIGLALSSALVHAHERGVVHRDVKPQNVLVPDPPTDGGHKASALVAAAKLTDFGGASLIDGEALTRTGDVLGTLAYMSPEQSEGHEAGPQSDLYSLALVIYEALSGVNPVRGATPAATVRRIGSSLPPLSRMRRDLPPRLTAGIDRALARSPGARGTLEELRGALEQALAPGAQRAGGRLGSRTRSLVGPARVPRAPLPRHEHEPHTDTAEQPNAARAAPGRSWLFDVPRGAWLALALGLALWQALAGRSGVALLALAALAPLLLLCGSRGASRAGVAWLGCALAPALGCAGLAGAYPALAGQAARWRERAALAAVGYWWLRLAEPLLGRTLWLGSVPGTPPRGVWEGSPSAAVSHVIAPLLVLGVLLGALLWAAAAVLLPLVVRGRSAVHDALAAAVWSAALVLAEPALDAGLRGNSSHPDPRGALLGAALGGLAAVVARALRGPV